MDTSINIFKWRTDPYQPLEKELKITQKCLEVLADFRNPVVIITKNKLVTRDIEILKNLAQYNAISVMISITTLDNDLCNRMEPRTSRPQQRLDTIKELTENGIPVGVMVAPIIPGLNNHEIPKIIEKLGEYRTQYARYTILRLPFVVKELFKDWLKTHYPSKFKKVMNLIAECRAGNIQEKRFKHRMSSNGNYAKQILDLFNLCLAKYKITTQGPTLSTKYFKNPNNMQISMFN